MMLGKEKNSEIEPFEKMIWNLLKRQRDWPYIEAHFWKREELANEKVDRFNSDSMWKFSSDFFCFLLN